MYIHAYEHLSCSHIVVADNIMLEVAEQQVYMSVYCMLHTFLKSRVFNIIVAVPMQAATTMYIITCSYIAQLIEHLS